MGRPPQGWHRADIKAALFKQGYTLVRVAQRHGVGASTIRKALIEPCFAGEQAILATLNRRRDASSRLSGHDLWPERYDPDGTPRHPRARRQHKARGAAGHRQKLEAA